MSITDELRNHAHKYAWDGGETYDQHLIYIADRIDEELANYIELPKDADGKTIHLGDEVEFRNGDRTMRGTVQALSDCWVAFGEGPYYGVKSCHHVKPDSWERIISDATALGAQMKRRTYQIGDFVKRCKRLAGEVE